MHHHPPEVPGPPAGWVALGDSYTIGTSVAEQDRWPNQVVARLPRGLDTRLGERGAGLSAGERQRVALARALLMNAPLLLLDEPTANLDGSTEEAVLRAIRRLVTGRTVVLAAHRPELVAMADRVVSLAPAGVIR